MSQPKPMTVPSSRFDWHDPPFADGRNGARIGLQPVPKARWLTQPMLAREYHLKCQLIDTQQSQVYACWAHDTQSQRNLAAEEALWQLAVSEGWGQRPLSLQLAPLPDSVRMLVERSPLVALSLCVAEDLCLMWRHEGKYHLLSACVCQPSYWSLTAKIGLALSAIHRPVADLDSAMAGRMDRFFSKMPAHRVFARRNWSIHSEVEAFQPQAAPDHGDCPSGTLFLRSERQSLRRVSDDLVAFAIRVDVEPLQHVREYPQALADLQTAVTELSPSALCDFGGDAKRRAVLMQLRSLSADV
ncbi:MAG: heme-dependent oxidative N-demethylase subunit alpha family protein [Pseudomonadales bacterium]